ncbi:UDP-N-acetylglucosamine 1-carboxyvinyltransferase, partial [bacterium]|nr:UDP-N-acetylglucosamine 1-carboxyvinyltransferase [bacterium]
WGPRPVDLHIDALQKLGADIKIEHGYIIAKAKRLKGAVINFRVTSVGATGNTLMAAVLAKGTTVIENAAKEPEIEALEKMLVKMGAKIDGIGTERLEIEGVDQLNAVDELIIPDRIEAATFIAAAAITGSRIILKNTIPEHLSTVLTMFEEAGVNIQINNNDITIEAPEKLKPVNISTSPYPGFPTDMQAQWTAMMSITPGISIIKDTIYLDRFNHIPELKRLGADIEVESSCAIVKGVDGLLGATVMSTDLRASASLIIAALAAKGRTDVRRVYHIDRGYEKIEEKLKKLGADIRREQE